MRTAAHGWVQRSILVVLLGWTTCGPVAECYAEPGQGLVLKVVPYPQEVLNAGQEVQRWRISFRRFESAALITLAR